MRRIFRSHRLETVEGVERLLNDNGIQTWMDNSRSYWGNRRSRPSFSNPNEQHSSLWIVHADDITRARQLLAEAGLLEVQRVESESAPVRQTEILTPEKKRVRTVSRLRTVLILVVLALAAYHAIRLLFFG
jgi:hypothetical protein